MKVYRLLCPEGLERKGPTSAGHPAEVLAVVAPFIITNLKEAETGGAILWVLIDS